ncbi:MAG: inorganic diphosphatase [Clostridia bacterium]|nr:inorganic diphosphatase [Clostridia bacterium]
MLIDKIDEKRITPHDFVVLVEITKGSKKKYELDKETGYMILDRVLYTSTHYPANYGLIPRTLASDGDHLDVLVLCSEQIETNCLVRCYAIGMIVMVDQDYLDEKIIAIPFGDPAYNTYTSINQLPSHITKEMMHFFSVYKALEGKQTAVQTVFDANRAKEKIIECMQAFRDKHTKKPTKAR